MTNNIMGVRRAIFGVPLSFMEETMSFLRVALFGGVWIIHNNWLNEANLLKTTRHG